MKGWSQRNMGETYHGVSQPSHREASYKKFRTAAAVSTRELPSVITPPEVQADDPAKSFCWSLFFFWFSPIPQFRALSPSCQYLTPYLWPGLSFPSSLHQSPFSLLSSILQPHFHFLLHFSPSCFVFFLCQAERDLTLINKFNLPRWSRNKVQTQKLIFFPRVFFFPFFFFCLFNASREKKRASEKHVVLLTWVMMSLAWSANLSRGVVSMFAARRDNLISSFRCGAAALLNQVCQKGQGTD